MCSVSGGGWGVGVGECVEEVILKGGDVRRGKAKDGEYSLSNKIFGVI